MFLFERFTNTELDKRPSFAEAINLTEEETSDNIFVFGLKLLRP
jgi:hypothetical protein